MDKNAAVPTKTAKETYNGSEYDMKLNPAGTVYSIICSSSVKEYQEVGTDKTDSYFASPECVVSNDYPMFSAISVDGNKLYYDAYQVIDGQAKKVDSFGISKSEEAKSPSEKAGNLLDGFFTFLNTNLNLKISWKLIQIFITIFTPLLQLFNN